MSTLAEQLGFETTDRVAVVHVDDIGMSHAANLGAFAALEHGPASCGSIMVPCPWFRQAAEHASAHPELDLGVHLTLNAEFDAYRWGPVAGRSAVPSLVDEQGYLYRTSLEVAQHAKSDEVLVELRAQVQMAIDAGVDVTHLDSHMGTVFFPAFVDVYRALAQEFRVPVFAARTDAEALEAQGMSAGALPVLMQVMDSMEADGFPVLDGFCVDSLGFAEGEGLPHNRRRLDRLASGVSYVVCHAAQRNAELDAITPDSSHQRDFERTFYGGAPGRDELEARGIKTVGMREIRALLR